MAAVLKLCVLFFSLLTPKIVDARIRSYKWEVKYEFKAQDCYKKLVIAINGRTPGPSILAEQGDTVIVEVKNGLHTENLAIHWHGIRQIGTPWSDGTEGVTQCPILPGDIFTYKFVVDRKILTGGGSVMAYALENIPVGGGYSRTSPILLLILTRPSNELRLGLWPGTYLYHAHYGMQRQAGLYGSIRVSVPAGVKEPFAYDYDRSIILNDWYHNSAQDQASLLSSRPFVWIGEPQSLLIQGRGRFNCSLLTSPSLEAGVCNQTNPECSPYVITVVPGKMYRLRISSLTSLSALNFEIEGHNMTIVEADGHYTEPIVVKNLNIYSGETYSVLVKADQDPSRNYWAATNIISRKPVTPTGLAIFNYYPNHPRRSPPTIPPTGPLYNDSDYRLAQSIAIKAHQAYIYPPPRTSDRVIVLLNTQNEFDGYRRWAVNNVSYSLSHTPYLIALKENLTRSFDQTPPPDSYDWVNYDIYKPQDNNNTTVSNSIYRLKFNTTVDIILQNANTMTLNNSETHPWHLHGHDFWVLGHGKGKFNPNNDQKKYNLVNPIMKNTVALHPFGWTAIRFRADNPGVWAFHCHIEAHFYMGMGIVFEEGVEKVGKLPSSIMGCGATKRFFHRP